MSTHEPPPYPWERGRHSTHDVVTVDVTVCRDQHGRVYSSHSLRGDQDRDIALSWPTGGQEQVGFALLTEAVRREAILTLLILMTHDPGEFERIRALSGDALRAEADRLGQTVATNLRRSIDSLSSGSLLDAIEMIAGADRGGPTG